LALVANFLVVPAVTVVLLYLFAASPMVAAGFLILAVCPGAQVGPPFATLAKGDVPAAVGMMVVLAGASAFLSPAILYLLLPRLFPDSELQVDYLAIVLTLLLTQILPLATGIVAQGRAPRFSAWANKPLALIANVLLLVVVLLVLINQFDTLAEIRLRGWLGMLLLLGASLAVGWFCGGPARTTRKSLAVTTAARNAGVGLVIVANNFAGTAAATAVVAYALVSILGSLGCALAFGALEKGHAERDPAMLR
jgi:BASS family bile acid:Na+ symporter